MRPHCRIAGRALIDPFATPAPGWCAVTQAPGGLHSTEPCHAPLPCPNPSSSWTPHAPTPPRNPQVMAKLKAEKGVKGAVVAALLAASRAYGEGRLVREGELEWRHRAPLIGSP